MPNIEENKKLVIDILKSTGRFNIDKLIDALEKSDFFEAPASTRFHLSYKGGLVEHSINVFNVLQKLNDTFKINIPYESVVIVGLLHDVCKTNIYHWNDKKQQYQLKVLAPKEHGKRSVKLLKKYIQLTLKEEEMIKWHMNHYTWDGNFKKEEDRLKDVCPEAYLAYFADHISSLFLEGDGK